MSLQKFFLYTKKYGTADFQIKSEAEFAYVGDVDPIRFYDGTRSGLFLYTKDMEYPEQGLPTTDDIFYTNIIKRMIMQTLKLKVLLSPTLIWFIISPKKTLNKIVDSFNDVAFKILSTVIVKDEFMTPMALEFKKMLSVFFKGVYINNYEQLAENIASIIQVDNAYRYRLQDLFNESSKERFKNPRKEIKRLLKIQAEREVEYKPVIRKFSSIANVLSMILLIPVVKRSFIKAIRQSNFDNLKPHVYDWFWMNLRGGYNYFGKTEKERLESISHLKVAQKVRIADLQK